MKILVVTPYYFPHFGGSQAYIHRLYTAVRKLDPKVSVDVLCYNTKQVAATEKIDGIRVIRVPAWELLPDQFALPNPIALLKTLRKLRGENYDIINAHTRFFDVSWWVPMVAWWFKAKSVFTDHCASFPAHSSLLVNAVNSFIERVLVPLTVPRYSAVTTVSEATGKYLQTLGIKNFTVFPGALPAQKAPDFSKKHANSIAFVGRLIPSKNPGLFVDAMNQLLKIYPKLSVVVAGNGPLLASLQASADPRIRFVGQLSATQVTELLKVSAILIHPSIHHEGLPQALLEAGQAGCAVLATNQGGSQEVIQDQQTGLIIQPELNDLIAKTKLLLKDPNLQKSLGKKLATHVAKQFNIDLVAQNYLTFLKELS